jgi:hypothetical protein
MANPAKERAPKRTRGPNIASLIAAAAATGRQLTGAIQRPGGVVELVFGDSPAPSEAPKEATAK